MRKLLVAAVGFFTLLTALPVYAVDVNFSGEVRVRSFWDDNLTDGNAGGGANEDMARFDDLRFRLKTSIKAGVTTAVVVADFSNCFFGADRATFNNAVGAGSPTGDCRFGNGGLGRSFNVVGVREAYLHIDLKSVGFILGRQTLKLGHGIVFDDTVDAITVVLPLGGATVTGSMLQVSDGTDALGVTTGINNDTTIWLLNVGMDHGSHMINLYDAFLYDQGASATPTVLNAMYPTGAPPTAVVLVSADKLWLNILGLSLDVKNGPMALALEGSYTLGAISNWTPGQDARIKGWNLMGDATVDTGGAKVGGTVVYASGQEQAAVNDVSIDDISGNFQLGNILLNNEQLSDRDGGSLGGGFAGMGILAVKLHADVMPSEKLTVGAAAIYGRTAELCSPIVCAAPSNDRTIGYELDANAKYKVDDNLAFSAGAGYLITANGAREFYSGIGGPANSNIWKLSAKAVFTF
nr:hypothetical protein [Nitrospirota bacterium]